MSEPPPEPEQEPLQGPDPEPVRRRSRRKGRAKRRPWLKRRIKRSVKTVRGVVAEPHKVPSQVRAALLKIWRTRGGGFYGFGYVVAFVVLEVRAFVGNFEGDGDIATMIVQEVLQFFFRFAAQSFINGFIAFGWPIFVLDYLGGVGLLVLGAGWVAFEYLAKPLINAWLPELAAPEEPEKPGAK
jgi:hypothetical protein